MFIKRHRVSAAPFLVKSKFLNPAIDPVDYHAQDSFVRLLVIILLSSPLSDGKCLINAPSMHSTYFEDLRGVRSRE